MTDNPVFLLHGLNSYPITLYPIERYLRENGWENCYSLGYYPGQQSIEESVNEVDTKMMEKADKEKDEIILIGQSMGGLIANNMHTKGWNIKKAIYIGSPLHGARIINLAEYVFPGFIFNFLKIPAWEILRNKTLEPEPPHDYHTISMGWYNFDFDGCVYRDETMLHPLKHTHLASEDHCFVFIKPRLWKTILLVMPFSEVSPSLPVIEENAV